MPWSLTDLNSFRQRIVDTNECVQPYCEKGAKESCWSLGNRDGGYNVLGATGRCKRKWRYNTVCIGFPLSSVVEVGARCTTSMIVHQGYGIRPRQPIHRGRLLDVEICVVMDCYRRGIKDALSGLYTKSMVLLDSSLSASYTRNDLK